MFFSIFRISNSVLWEIEQITKLATLFFHLYYILCIYCCCWFCYCYYCCSTLNLSVYFKTCRLFFFNFCFLLFLLFSILFYLYYFTLFLHFIFILHEMDVFTYLFYCCFLPICNSVFCCCLGAPTCERSSKSVLYTSGEIEIDKGIVVCFFCV